MTTSSSGRLALRVVILIAALVAAPIAFAQQNQKPAAKRAVMTSGADQAAPKAMTPLYREYRGVNLGMKADDVHSKLGSPSTSDDNSDTYIRSDKELATVYYDADKNVVAVVTTYTGRDAGAPAAPAVLGKDAASDESGMVSEMVRYPDAGYWVSYSVIPGDEPVTIVTIRKMQ
jgi:hypothetical protein